MKTYRIVYWFNPIIMTEWFTKANSKEEAQKIFEVAKGNRKIVSIEES